MAKQILGNVAARALGISGFARLFRCPDTLNAKPALSENLDRFVYCGFGVVVPRSSTPPVVLHSRRFSTVPKKSSSALQALRLESFHRVGQELIQEGYYQGLVDAILDTAAEPRGFLVLDSPSGSGKSQAANELQQLDHTREENLADCVDLKNNKLRVAHLIWDAAVPGQSVYRQMNKAFKGEGFSNMKFFQQCREFADKHRRTEFDEMHEEIIWRDLVQYMFEETEEETFNVQSFRRRHKLKDAIFVVFIDEFPKDREGVQTMLVVREALRTIPKLVLVLAETSAKAGNHDAVSLDRGHSSSFEESAPVSWGMLVTRLPHFRLECLPTLNEEWQQVNENARAGDDLKLKSIVSVIDRSLTNGGNPRLIIFAIGALFDVLPLEPSVRWKEWQSRFSWEVTKNKFLAADSWYDLSGGLISQLNLLLQGASSSDLSDVMLANHFAFRVVPDNGMHMASSKSAKLKDIGGWLYIATPRDRLVGRCLEFLRGPVQHLSRGQRQRDWQTTVFASFATDPLLYFGCCRQGGYFSVMEKGIAGKAEKPGVVKEEEGEEGEVIGEEEGEEGEEGGVVEKEKGHVLMALKAHEIVMDLWKNNAAGAVNYQNPSSLCNTGGLLEVMTAVACCNAAAMHPLPFLTICEFFGNLMTELGLRVNPLPVAKLLESDTEFVGYNLPRCIFPGDDLYIDLIGLAAVISRMPDSDEFELRIRGVFEECIFVEDGDEKKVILPADFNLFPDLAGECKDRRSLGTAELVKVFRKSSRRSGIGFLVVRSCNQYWETSAKSPQHAQKNLAELKASLLQPVQITDDNGKETTEFCKIRKVWLFSDKGKHVKLDLENNEAGRIILIQVPPSVLGQ